MALVTRTLTNSGEPLSLPDGNVLAGAVVIFELVNEDRAIVDAWDGSSRIGGKVSAVTDINGEFSISLWPNDRGSSTTYYLCRVEGVPDFSPVLGQVAESVGPLQWVDFAV